MDIQQNPEATASKPTTIIQTASFAGDRITGRYVMSMGLFALAAFAIILLVPFWYDQMNHGDYEEAREQHRLLVRECLGPSMTAEFAAPSAATQPSRLDPSEFLRGKRLIAVDYIQQMEQVRNLEPLRLFLFASILAMLLVAVLMGILYFVREHFLRTLGISVLFLSTLLALQWFGLPHTNHKFHIIFGVVFAMLIILSDFYQTLNLGLTKNRVAAPDPAWAGYLSSLQYKHRFWTMIFNVAVLTVLSVLCTMSFLAYNAFMTVFGEGFVSFPLIGLMVTVSFALIGVFYGILRPIRQHVASIEDAMIDGK